MSLETLSGLEIMQGLADGRIPAPSITGVMPLDIISVEKGRLLCETRADQRHLNPLGAVHGGFASTILDSVTACTVHTMLEPGVGYGTIELNVKMLRPVPLNQRLLAEGTIISLSKSLGVSQASLKDEQGRIFAHATATCMIQR